MDFGAVDILLQLIGVALPLVGGAEIFRRFWFGPRLYRSAYVDPIMPLGESGETSAAEEAHAALGYPTADLTVSWWNAGRAGASDLRIGVDVPGEIVDWKMRPADKNDLSASWDAEERGRSELRIHQPELHARTYCRLRVKYAEQRDAEPDIRTYWGGGREIPDFNESTLLSVLESAPFWALGAGVLVALTAGSELFQTGLSVATVAALVGLVVGVALGLAVPRWKSWIRSRESLGWRR